MSDSYSNGKYNESINYYYTNNTCLNYTKHIWKPQTPYYGMATCIKCKKVIYTK